MKQSALAAASGLSESTISRIESGKSNYNRVSLEAIAKALGTRPGFLLEIDPATLPIVIEPH